MERSVACHVSDNCAAHMGFVQLICEPLGVVSLTVASTHWFGCVDTLTRLVELLLPSIGFGLLFFQYGLPISHAIAYDAACTCV